MAKDEKESKETKEPKEKKVVKKAAKVKGKKKWVTIIAPKSFDSITLGETHVEEPNKAVGKTVVANLMNLTGDMRKQGVEIRFDVVKVTDGKAYTAATGYELVPGTLKRLIRRGRSKVSDSLVLKTATGRFIRIKPVIITANPASQGACTEMRLKAREKLKQVVLGVSFDRLLQDLIEYKVQRVVRDDVNRTHPVKNVEVKSCVLLPEGTSERREVREDSREEDFVTVTPPAAEQAAPEAAQAAEEETPEQEAVEEPDKTE
jgi:ribosomal protein S3AE